MTSNSVADRRFGGMSRLYGVTAAQRVAQSHVMIVGIGGVGSWVAEALARSGTGELTLVDMDHVAESNVNRQIHAIESTFGQAKILAMKDRIASLMAVNVEQINIKAKTNEGLGYLGEHQAIETQTTVLIAKNSKSV